MSPTNAFCEDTRRACKTIGTDWRLMLAAVVTVAASGCGGSDDPVSSDLARAQSGTPTAVTVPYTNGAVTPDNPVAYWNKIATDTINVAPTPGTGTPEEQRPVAQVDLATVHVAIYDAVMAIVRTHQPYAVSDFSTDPTGASQEAAVAAAAYGVLKALFPNRSAQYQAAYDTFAGNLQSGDATVRGIALGAEVAAKIVARRANDGRMTAATFTPGTEPGKFRGTNPIGVYIPYIKPFTLTGASQFRLPPPFALGSPEYAADYAEVKALGGSASTTRTAEQFEIARFHTENPGTQPTRNYRQFALNGRPIADNARVMAMLWVAAADAAIAMFDTKYYYAFWRPVSAITLGSTDGNDATVEDTTWAPSVPTPNHPEYPSAHLTQNSATGAVLKAFFGTDKISYSFSSTVTGTVHDYTGPDALLDEATLARIAGGMHFRNSNVQGRVQGTNVGQWVVANYFRPK